MRIIPFLFCCLLTITVNAQDVRYARMILDSLCHADMDGRGYVNQGERRAAEFIANQFRQLEIGPLGDDYFQEFQTACNTLPGKMSVSVNKIPLVPGEDYLVDADAPSLSGSFPVMPLPREAIEDSNLLTLRIVQAAGAFLFLDEKEFDLTRKEDQELLHELAMFLKHFEHPQFLFKGILVRSEQKLNWSPSPVQGLRPLIRINADKLPEKVKRITVDIEAEYHESYPSQNVIGIIPGTIHPDSAVVITAHYDHLGRMGAETYFPGANDNASGIAMMLSLARYYAQPENRPNKSLIFMAFGSEEIGLKGSIHYVQNPIFPLVNINFLINLDILGTGDDGIQVVNGSIYRDQFSLMQELNTDDDLLAEVRTRGAMCKSDHCFFHENGVPSFYIYTLGGVAFYHDVFDKPETLPLTEFYDLFTLLRQFINQLNANG